MSVRPTVASSRAVLREIQVMVSLYRQGVWTAETALDRIMQLATDATYYRIEGDMLLEYLGQRRLPAVEEQAPW